MNNRSSHNKKHEVSESNLQPVSIDKKIWQSPRIIEIDYTKTHEQVGEGVDDSLTHS